MRVPRIYTGQTLQVGASVELEAGASQHIARALRMTPGDPLALFNGRGDEYRAELLTVGKKQVVAAVNERRERQSESTLSLHLGIAISRGDRMDWVVQKATELGVSALTPLFTERTEVKLAGERAEKKLHHWRQIAISACEQCGRNRLPEISGLMDLGSWLDGTEAERKFVLHHRADARGPDEVVPESIALLVGPEGGLGEAEIEAAEEAGFESLALGPRVLRTETAPLAAIAILQARWGDMGLS
jgi:16S rRNA (uracil1498-N3)-methyltransferase